MKRPRVAALAALVYATATAGVAANDHKDLVAATMPNTTLEARPVHSLAKRGAYSGKATWYDVETWEAGYVHKLRRQCLRTVDR